MRFLNPGLPPTLIGATSLANSFHFKLFLLCGIDLANDEARVIGLGAGSRKVLTDVGGDVYMWIFMLQWMTFQVVKQIRGAATFPAHIFRAYFADEGFLFMVLEKPEPLPENRASAVFLQDTIIHLNFLSKLLCLLS